MNASPQRLLGLALVGCLLLAAPAHARDGEKPPPAPSEAARALLERQGFAVEVAARTGLSAVYRFPPVPMIITTDAGLATYLALLRRIVTHLGGGWDAEAREHVLAWQQTLATKDVDLGTAFVVRLLARLYEEPEGSPEDLEAEIARLKRGDDDTPFPHLGTPLARSAAQLWVGDYLGGSARWQVLVYLLTRLRFADTPAGRQTRMALQSSMPKGLALAVGRYVTWVGAAEITYPGTRDLFDLRMLGDRRLPPGTLTKPAARDLPAFLAGAAVANAEAHRRMQALGAPRLSVREPAKDSLRARMDSLLRLLADKPQAAPKLFKQPAWEVLELQTILGANVQFDKAVGVATAPWDVFGGEPHPGFVYPHPGFWRALASLATDTAAKAKAFGIQDWELPSAAEIETLARTAERKLKSGAPFTEGEIHLLTRCGASGWDIGLFSGFGKDRYRGLEEKKRASWHEDLREHLLTGQRALIPWARKAAAKRGLPAAVPRLDELAKVFLSLAEVADAQEAGKRLDDLQHRLWSFGRTAHRILSGYGEEDPFVVCVPRLRDGPLTLFQGCAGMDTLWVRYPWKDGHLDCRGAVFAYRELISRTWVADGAWLERVNSKRPPPPRPAWSSIFVAR